jgi:hypothetical protein
MSHPCCGLQPHHDGRLEYWFIILLTFRAMAVIFSLRASPRGRIRVGRIKAADQATGSRSACDRKQNNDIKSGEKHV